MTWHSFHSSELKNDVHTLSIVFNAGVVLKQVHFKDRCLLFNIFCPQRKKNGAFLSNCALLNVSNRLIIMFSLEENQEIGSQYTYSLI